MLIETLISTAVVQAAKGLKESKGGKQAIDDLSVGFWNWIKPIFIKEDPVLTEVIEATPETEASPLIRLALIKKKNDQVFIDELENWMDIIKRSETNSGNNSKINVQGDNNATITGSSDVNVNYYKSS